MKKTILTLLALVIILASFTVIPTQAAFSNQEETVMPRWSNTIAINPSVFQYNETKGAAEIAVSTLSTSKTDICIKIYQLAGSSWVQITEGSTTSYAPVATYSLMFDATSGHYYKAEFIITVTRAGVSDSINKSKTIYFE